MVILDATLVVKPRKRRAIRPRSLLDVKFLRRSGQISKYLKGFRTQKDADEAEHVLVEHVAASDAAPIEPVPLAIISAFATPSMHIYQGAGGSGSITPHLPHDVLGAIGTGFLKMQPEVVSPAALLASDDE